MILEGSKQGQITAGTFTADSVGNIYQEGHENKILVQAFNHQVIVPRDPQSGQPTGQRVHKPLMITKVFDKSSPLIFQALISGETLNKCHLAFYRTSGTGGQDPATAHFTQLEDVYFTYRKIIWTHEVSGTSGSDDWRTANAA